MANAQKLKMMVLNICRLKRHVDQLEERLTCLVEQARGDHCDTLFLLEMFAVYELILSVLSKIILLCT